MDMVLSFFRCDDCGAQFDCLVCEGDAAPQAECPTCGSTRTHGEQKPVEAYISIPGNESDGEEGCCGSTRQYF
jgi:DNA-directed RNA polymerase subunit RPC12/RpoP